ncbi:MAG: hypothetical protein Devi2KO_31750 [Devosia indica]
MVGNVQLEIDKGLEQARNAQGLRAHATAPYRSTRGRGNADEVNSFGSGRVHVEFLEGQELMGSD